MKPLILLRHGSHRRLNRAVAVAVAGGALLLASTAPVVAAADTAAPVLSNFTFTPTSVDSRTGLNEVTVSARLADETGVEAPTLLLSSDTTGQTAGFGAMTLLSGSSTDGVWTRTVTIQAGAAGGPWTVKIYPLSDVLGNDDGTFHHHPTKLSVYNPPADTAPPQLKTFDFTPPRINVSSEAQTVTVTAQIADPSGVKDPYMIMASEDTTQTRGFGVMTRVAGTVQDGTWSRTISMPTTVAPGRWRVTLYPLEDSLGNDGQFEDHPSKLRVDNQPPSLPGPPTGLTARSSSVDDQVLLSWAAPANDGNAAIAEYTVTSSPGGERRTFAASEVATQAGPHFATIAGLSPNTVYTFSVAATNVVGTGAGSIASDPVTTTGPSRSSSTVPSAPPLSLVAGDRLARVSWAPADSDGGSPVTGYVVTLIPSVGGSTALISRTVAASDRSALFTNLSNGMPYTVEVRSSNAIGNSAPATGTVIPATVPSSPQVVTALRGNGAATVQWSAPALDGGLPVTHYAVSVSPDGSTRFVSSTARSIVLTGLRNGSRYTFSVVALNPQGAGAAAVSNAVVPAGPPERPAKPKVVSSKRSAVVSWVAPPSNGASVTSYRVRASTGAVRTVSGPVKRLRFAGLKPRQRVSFTIRATNIAGISAYSIASNPVKIR